jgi:Kef-type K+ transport system membrane component KefB
LAVVLATTGDSFAVAGLAIGGGLLYAASMLTVGRRLLARFDRPLAPNSAPPSTTLAALIALLLLCAWFTEAVGIHAVFGAFLAGGAVMPRGALAEWLRRAIEPVTLVVLAPAFFAYSGLNTALDLLVDRAVLGVAVLVVLVGFLAKGVACALASWRSGAAWRDAAALGALMNARGLMELVLINIALDKGLITPALFTILVVLTVVTTMLAAPAVRWLYRVEPGARSA